ncbi:putative disease resistance protein At3g14460 [Quercus robur]|uniref:putative disease resistance protein At3g14460 n=1 Tax=Quercus robur TaxID=38942 RepID=UPI0021631354|nr:putative disease resistance protein At3g14460 [Quercus robur]
MHSPLTVAIWDLFFNIRSNEIEDYFLEEFKVQDAIYCTEDFVDKIRSEALNDRLDATSPTKKSTLHKIHFRPMWMRNLPFWPKQTLEVKKGIRREAKKIVDEFKSLEMEGRALHLQFDVYYRELSYSEHQRNLCNGLYQGDLQNDIDRDRDEEAIIELLLSDDGSGKRLSVIPIVAEGGMGKTTLARRVYDNHRVSEHFDLKAWAWFPGKGDLLQATKAIVESFTSQSCNLGELTSLQHRLCEILKNKKFLIVLDDVLVENYDSWSQLLNPFIDAAAKGSRIIVTTPYQADESTMRTKGYNSFRITASYLKPLSDEECWSIFVKYAFGDERLNSNPELEYICRQFVRKCSGVPLAVRTLGALLFNRLEANKKLGQLVEGWRTKLDQFIRDYRSPDLWYVLRLCYDNLPPRLKRCFAYCSIFPEGYEFEKEKLVLLWMAEGLLPQIEGNLTPEEDNSSSHISERARYLLLSAEILASAFFSHYDITELHDSIGDLEHLRYMDLSHTAIRRLPESVCALRKLQTLILSHCRTLTELPENMWKLFDLRHLDISGTDLNEMPKEMSRFKNLQTLSDFVVGKESGSTIKELGGLLYLHGTLRISKLQNMVSPEDTSEAILKEKELFDELVLEWGDDTADREHDREMLTMLEPHRNLKKLSVKFDQGTSFRGWLGSGGIKNSPTWMLEWEEWISLERPGGEFPCLQELCIRRCPKLKGNLPKQFPSIKKVEIFDSQELVSTLLTLVSSLKWRLHYHDKILFRSDDKAVSFIKERTVFTHEGAAESSMTITQGVTKSSLPNTWSNQYGRHDLSSSEIVEISEETDLPIRPHRHKLEGSYALEDIPEGVRDTNLYYHGNMLLRSDEEAAESSLPSQTPNTDDAHVLTDQDGLEDLSSLEIMEVSEISQLMELPTGLHGLKIEGCDALEDIPEGMMDNKPFLQHLYIFDCYSLKSFPEKNPNIALKLLYIQNCKRLDFLPPSSKTNQYALLEHLCIGSSCDPLRSLPLGFFPKLRSLSIWDCANLESFTMPEGIQKDLTSLEALEIRDCPKLVSFPKGGLPTPNLTSICQCF